MDELQIACPSTDCPTPEITCRAEQAWHDAAAAAGADLSGLEAAASLKERLAWAIAHGFECGIGYWRSTSHQSRMTLDPILELIEFAARHKIYMPPEHLCIDEAIGRRASYPAGLERALALLRTGVSKILVTGKLSRLLRTGAESVALIQGEIVDSGLHAVSVAPHIDTREANWRLLVHLHLLMDHTRVAPVVRRFQ